MGITIKNIVKSATHFIMLQLFISCISLPILGYWGLPQPLLSPVGNIVFAPFLTIFLLFSTLAFFAYIFALPSASLIWVLEKITALWTFFLTIDIPIPFASCIRPPLYLIIGVPLCAFFIITHHKLRKPFLAIPSLLILLLTTHAILFHLHTPKTFLLPLECNGGTVTIIKNKNTVIVIDPGVIGKRLSATSWCEYTLLPEIIKKTGNSTIDYFICLKLGKNLFDALTQLACKASIRHLYIPWWTNHIPPTCWRSYMILKKAISDSQGKIHFISQSGKMVENTTLSINSTQEMRSYYDAQFPQFYIEGIIDNNRISIYAP